MPHASRLMTSTRPDPVPAPVTSGLGLGLLLTGLTFLFRLPAFLNFGALDSDIAIVGLQSWHLGEGPHPLLLWGTTYQGVTAPLMARLVEWVLPVDASLALSSVLGHTLLVLSLYGVLKQRLPATWAALATGYVVVCPEPLNFLTYSAFRIWAFAFLFAGLYLAERADQARAVVSRGVLALLAGVAVGLGYYSDLFTLQLMPGVVLYLMGWTWELDGARWPSVGAMGLGFAMGSIPRWLAGMSPPQLSELSWENLARNWPLFWEQCLPYVLGTKLFATTTGYDRPERALGGGWLLLAGVAMVLFVGLWVAGGLLGVLPGGQRGTRRLAWCGAAWGGVCLIGFLFTLRPQDMMSARYLVPLLLAFPLLLTSVLARLPRERGAWWVVLLLAPVLLHFGVEGWRGYGGWLDGWGLPQVTRAGRAEDARELLAALQQRGVTAAMGDYWVSFRLTYLFREQVTVAPGTGDQRQFSYTERFEVARRRALVFSPIIPGAFNAAGPWERRLTRQRQPFERLTAEPYTVLILN